MLQRILLMTGLALSALAAYLWGEPYSLAVTLSPSVGFTVQARLLLLLAAVAVAFLGSADVAAWVGRQQDGGAGGGRWVASWRAAVLSWAAGGVPALLVLGVFLVAGAWPQGVPSGMALAVLAVTLPLTLATAEGAKDAFARRLQAALHPAGVYLAALASFTGVISVGAPAQITVPAIGFVASALASILWRIGLPTPAHECPIEQGRVSQASMAHMLKHVSGEARLSRLWRVGLILVAGFVVAQVAWPLVSWPVSALIGGLALLGAFYAVAGVLGEATHPDGRVRAMVEYAVVGLMAVCVLIAAVLRGR